MPDNTRVPKAASGATTRHERNADLYRIRAQAQAAEAEAIRAGNKVKARRAARRSEGAEAALFQENLGLVMRICRPFRTPGRETNFDEYVEAGQLALFEAIRAWDPEKGKLGFFSKNYIRKAVQAAVGRTELGLTRHAFGHRPAIMAARQELIESLGREPSDEEIAKHGGLHLELVQNVRRAEANRYSVSFDAQYNNERSLTDSVPDPTPLADQSNVSDFELQHLHVEDLSPHALWCGLRYYGLDNSWPEKLRTIGAKLGVSRETARRHIEDFDAGVRQSLESSDSQENLVRD